MGRKKEKRGIRFWLSITLLITGLIIVSTISLFPRIVGGAANYVLANAINPLDREPPPTSQNLSYTSNIKAVIGGQGRGLNCSVPEFLVPLAFGYANYPKFLEPVLGKSKERQPIGLQMRQACVFHDYCYRHGSATYGYTQADCDFFLQEHAFRLCTKSISQRDAKAFEECQTDARKVTLGVRIFGAKPFLRADEADASSASSYFEFDTLPRRSEYFASYRVASTPQVWVNAGASERAIYRFRSSPSGTRAAIITPHKVTGKLFCTELQLSGSFQTVTAPPILARDGKNGEEWFVWWRRKASSNTRGSVAMLSPKYAGLVDWHAVANYVTEVGCYTANSDKFFLDRPKLQTSLRPDGLGASTRFRTKDGDFSALQSGVDELTDGVLRLMAIGNGSCSGSTHENQSTCFLAIDLKPGALTDDQIADRDSGKYLTPTPLSDMKFTRFLSRREKCVGTRRKGCHNYRDLTLQPVFISSPDGSEFSWLRRDEDHQKQTRLVLNQTVPKNSDNAKAKYHEVNVREVILDGLKQEFEPLAFVKNGAPTPVALSIIAGSTHLQFKTWPLANGNGKDNRVGKDSICGNLKISNEWLKRPAQVIERERKVEILFTKASISNYFSYDKASKKHFAEGSLDARLIQWTSDGCKDSKAKKVWTLRIPNSRGCAAVSRHINLNHKKISNHDVERKRCERATAKSLNQRPLLAANLEGGTTALVLPHHSSPRTFMWSTDAFSQMRSQL